MDEYLFYQQHKKELAGSSMLSPRITDKGRKLNKSPHRSGSMTDLTPFITQGKASFSIAPLEKRVTQPIRSSVQWERNAMHDQTVFELTDESMKDNLQSLSLKNTDKFISAGFPPKICTLLMEELCEVNRIKTKVLDVGCGKGFVGKYLKNSGFLHINGMDCSKSLIQSSKDTNCYEKLEKVAIGDVSQIDTSKHNEKYDFVVSATMINNDGWDENVFFKLLDYVKMGGFVIFATKLNLHGDNQYGSAIEKLAAEQYWEFVTEHTFFRYDKLCDGKGKFSNKKVKVLAYQKTDHGVWVRETAIERADAARRQAVADAELEGRLRAKNDKLGAADRELQRKADQAQKEVDDALLAEAAAKQAAEEAAKAAIRKKANYEKMMKRFKGKVRDLMWQKLKEQQKEAERLIQEKRALVMKKMDEEKAVQQKQADERFNPAG